jgi:hypothetical protein
VDVALMGSGRGGTATSVLRAVGRTGARDPEQCERHCERGRC